MSMTVEIADVSAEVLAALTAPGTPLLAALGGPYVSTPQAPPAWNNSHRAVIFHVEDDTSHSNAAINRSVVTCKCYSGSGAHNGAGEVARALRKTLHNYSGGKIRRARYDSGFQGPLDDDTGWPVQVAKFRVETFNEEASNGD